MSQASPWIHYGVSSALASVLSLLCGCGAGSDPVVRLVDGQECPGRWISPSAYAAYTEAAYFEARNQDQRALEHYQRAARLDANSAEIWTRIGALLCARSSAPVPDAFVRAYRLDEQYAPLWKARALCHLQRGNVEAALTDALRAVVLDPNDPEGTLVLARIYVKRGELVQAARWLRALGLRDAGARVAWEKLADVAVRLDMPSMRDEAHDQLRRWIEVQRPEQPEVEPQELDLALARDDLKAARRLAVRVRVSPGELALRAVVLGRLSAAERQSELVLAAEPEEPDAWVAAIVVADLRRDDEQLAMRLARASAIYTEALSPLAARLMTELIARRVGFSAAEAFELAAAQRTTSD